MLHWSLITLMLGMVTQLSAAVNIRTLCRTSPFGTLLPNPRDCNSYFVCQAGPQLAYCDHGLHFDRINKVCNWPQLANCRLEEIEIDISFEPEESEVNSNLEEVNAGTIIKSSNENVEDVISNTSSELQQPEGTITQVSKEDVKETNSAHSVETSQPEENPQHSVQEIEEELEETPHVQLSKEPAATNTNNTKIDSHGLSHLIVSSISKNLTDNDVIITRPDFNPVLTVEVPLAPPSNVIQIPVAIPVEVPRPSQTIQVPVAVPEDIDNSNKPGSSKENESPLPLIPEEVPKPGQVIQVPVVIAPGVPHTNNNGIVGVEPGKEQTDSSEKIKEDTPKQQNVETGSKEKVESSMKDISSAESPEENDKHELKSSEETLNLNVTSSSEEDSLEASQDSLQEVGGNSSNHHESSEDPNANMSSESDEYDPPPKHPNEIPVADSSQSESKQESDEYTKPQSVESSEENQTLVLESSEESLPVEHKFSSEEDSVESSQDSAQKGEITEGVEEGNLSQPDKSSEEDVEKPIKNISAETGESDSPSSKPNHIPGKESPIKPIDSHKETPSVGHHSNLIVSILSVVSSKDNETINRAIVGAHNTETGTPVDVMTGYDSHNVRCIHDGLYFLPHPISCQKYFICAYRHLHLHSCGRDVIWNFKREQCELEYDSRCYSNETFGLPDPGSPDDESFEEESVEEVILPTTKKFIPTPMPPLRTTQAKAITDSSMPVCPLIGQDYLPSFDDCNQYYICILGQPVLTSCPDNLHWDAKGQFCGQPTVARCASSTWV